MFGGKTSSSCISTNGYLCLCIAFLGVFPHCHLCSDCEKGNQAKKTQRILCLLDTIEQNESFALQTTLQYPNTNSYSIQTRSVDIQQTVHFRLLRSNTAKKASWGISTFEIVRNFFFPRFCASSNFFFRVESPPPTSFPPLTSTSFR